MSHARPAVGKCPGSSAIKCCTPEDKATGIPLPNAAQLANPRRAVLFGASVMTSRHVGVRYEAAFNALGYATVRWAEAGRTATQLVAKAPVVAALKGWKPSVVFIAAGTNKDWSQGADTLKSGTSALAQIEAVLAGVGVAAGSYKVVWLGAFPECRAGSGYAGTTSRSRASNIGLKAAVGAWPHPVLWLDPFDVDTTDYGEMPRVGCADGLHPSSRDGLRLVDATMDNIRRFLGGGGAGAGAPPTTTPPAGAGATATATAGRVLSACERDHANGTCLNERYDACQVLFVTGLCTGPAHIRCCPTGNAKTVPPPPPPPAWGSTKCEQETRGAGRCWDTATATCSAEYLTGYCPGAANIKCCPTGTAPPLPPPPPSSCTRKYTSGACLDDTSDACGTAFETGLCPGASNIRCCPTGRTGAGTGAGAGASVDAGAGAGAGGGAVATLGPEPGPGPGGWAVATTRRPSVAAGALSGCSKGQAGSCVDTFVLECVGAATLSGYCAGAAHIRCCPEPGYAADYLPYEVRASACVVMLTAGAGGPPFAIVIRLLHTARWGNI